MITKLFEVRDRMTFLPVMATKMIDTGNNHNHFLLERAGYCHKSPPLIFLVRMGPRPALGTYDYEEWCKDGSRTMHIAHKFIEENFDSLESGAVIDVEFILGENPTRKESEIEGTIESREADWEELMKDVETIYV